jgi:CubicO group peptidase (beta-lactamase class C family)
MMASALLALLLAAAAEQPAGGECNWSALPPAARDIAAGAQSLVTSGKVMAFAFAVASEGQVLCEEAFGWADRDHRVAATPRSAFGAGSVAKSITGTAVYLLVQRGKLKLADSPEKHGVKVRTFGKDAVTIDELLAMTAGVPHGWFYPSGPAPREDRILRSYAIEAFHAGQSFEYSNFSFGILGEIVSAASGKPYDEFVASEIFRQLGMTSTSFEPRQFFPRAAGGLYTSVHDLALFGSFHLGPSMKAIHGSSTPDLSRRGYRAGWGHIAMGQQQELWLSNGNVNAGAAALLLLPRKNIVISVATNTPGDSADEFAFQLAEAFSPGLVANFGSMRQSVEAEEAPKPFAGGPPYQGHWIGAAYLPAARLPLELTFSGETAAIAIGKRATVPVTDLHLEAGRLTGRVATSIELPGLGAKNTLQLELESRGGRLHGILRVVSTAYGLPVYVALRRRNAGNRGSRPPRFGRRGGSGDFDCRRKALLIEAAQPVEE